jgi:hypothetical protein
VVRALGEVEVFDRQQAATVGRGQPQQLADRGTQPAVAGAGRLPVQVEDDRVRLAERVACG